MDNQQDSILKKIKKRLTRKVMIIIFILVGLGAVAFIGVSVKIPSSPLKILQSGPSVALKKEYKNPFSKETQYVNPFDTYKNPFVVSK